MRASLLRIIEYIERSPLTLGSWTATFTAIVLGRFTIENFLSGYHFTWFFLLHEFFFFLLTFLLALLILHFIGKISFENAIPFLTYGFLIILTPPILDFIISGGKGFFIAYLFEDLPTLGHQFLTFFGGNLEHGITYGVRIEIALVILGGSFYVWMKTMSWVRTIATASIMYVLLFFLAAFPSFMTFFVRGFSSSKFDVVAMTISPTSLFGFTPTYFLGSFDIKMSLTLAALTLASIGALFFFWKRSYFIALWKNARFPQLVYHAGLVILGALLAFLYTRPALLPDFFHFLGFALLIAGAQCSWLASVVVNDLHDAKIDAITNSSRPVPTKSIPLPAYSTMGALFFLGAILFSLTLSVKVTYLFLVYQGIAWTYSAWPLRLKRFPLIATLLAASASLMIFFSGYILLSPEKSLAGLPWQIPTFLFVAYALLLPIKDFKDIEGDRADGVYTLPVLLGESLAKRLIGATLLLLFVASVFVLRVPHLFWLAFFFGALSYWLLQISSREHRTFPYRFLSGWYIALAFAYGAFLFFALR